MSKKEKFLKIKWAGPNTPMIIIGDENSDQCIRMYPSKRELKQMHEDLDSFIKFYKQSFSNKNIDFTDNEV